MIGNELGPEFKSCFTNHRRSEYGEDFTVDMVKKMCYEDARLIPYLLNSKAFMKWVKDVRKFSEGNSVLADTILGMTDCYAEYLTRKIGKTCATKRMQQYIQTLNSCLKNSFVPFVPKVAFKPFAAKAVASTFDISSFIVDVDAEKKFCKKISGYSENPASYCIKGLVRLCEPRTIEIVR